jgi:ubiquinone/menaquinone biosynthesis C-methylase UbiE
MNDALIHRLIQFCFDRLYTTFAWSYDVVAAAASLGEWKVWGAATLEFLPLNVVAKDTPLLEIAHGPGHLHARLREQGVHAVGIDRSPQMGRLTRARCGRSAALARADALALPFIDAAFAAIVCTFPASFVFQAHALREVARVLRTGGAYVVVPYAVLRGRDPLSRFIAAAHRITGGTATHAAVEARVGAAFAAAGMRFESHRVRTPRADVTVWVGRRP